MSKKKRLPKKPVEKNNPKPKAITNQGALMTFLTNIRLNCLLIFVFSFILYSNTISHDYTQDDAIVIIDNMYTKQGLGGIDEILKYDTFKGFFKTEGKDKLVEGGRYRPFTLILFAIEWHFFKTPDKNPDGSIKKDSEGNTVYTTSTIGHIFNILFYALTGIVLYLLLLQLLLPGKGEVFAYGVAFMSTFLFMAHPLHTEAVANIKGRDEIIALLGSLTAAYWTIRAYYEKRPLLYYGAALVFLVALLSKENTITFLAVVPLMFYFFTKAKPAEIFKYSVPLLISTIVFLGIRGSVLGWSLGESSMELMNNPFLKIEGNQWVPFSAGEKLATIFYTLGKYIQLLIFPHPLTHDYYPRQIDIMQWSDWQSIGSLLLYLGMFAYAIKGLKKKDPVSFGILYFLVTLSIVSNIVFAVGVPMSERFMFMPSVGFCLIVGVLGYRLAERMAGGKVKSFTQLNAVLILTGIVVLLFSVKTITRNQVWKDNFTLFTSDIQTSPNSAKLNNAVAGELIRVFHTNTNEALKEQKLREAAQYLEKALSIHPTYKNSMLQLGNCYNYLKEYEKSISYYNKILAMVPNDQEATNNLGITYREAGKFYGEQKGDVTKATQYLEKAYELRPNEYETLRLLGVAYGIQGQHNSAINYFSKALEVNPESAEAHWNLGNAYYYIGNETKATELRQKAIQIDPEVANRGNKK